MASLETASETTEDSAASMEALRKVLLPIRQTLLAMRQLMAARPTAPVSADTSRPQAAQQTGPEAPRDNTAADTLTLLRQVLLPLAGAMSRREPAPAKEQPSPAGLGPAFTPPAEQAQREPAVAVSPATPPTVPVLGPAFAPPAAEQPAPPAPAAAPPAVPAPVLGPAFTAPQEPAVKLTPLPAQPSPQPPVPLPSPAAAVPPAIPTPAPVPAVPTAAEPRPLLGAAFAQQQPPSESAPAGMGETLALLRELLAPVVEMLAIMRTEKEGAGAGKTKEAANAAEQKEGRPARTIEEEAQAKLEQRDRAAAIDRKVKELRPEPPKKEKSAREQAQEQLDKMRQQEKVKEELYKLDPSLRPKEKEEKPEESKGGGIAGAFAALKGGFGQLTAAVGMVKQGFDQLKNAITPYVEAFSPSAVMVFNMALRDTTAVIGRALVPVMHMLTQIVRGVGDALVPIMAQLAPIVQTLSGVFLELVQNWLTNMSGLAHALMPLIDFVGELAVVLAPVIDFMNAVGAALGGMLAVQIKVLVEVLKLAMGVLQPFMEALKGVTYILRAWGVIAHGVAAGLGQLFGRFFGGADKLMGPLMDAATRLKESLMWLAKSAITTAGALAKLAGWNKFIEGMKKALGADVKKGGSGGTAAVQNAQVTDMMSFARNLAVAASMAQGGAGESKEDQFRREMLEALDGIDDRAIQIKEWLESVKMGIVAELAMMPAKIAAALLNRPLTVGSHVVRQNNPFGPFGPLTPFLPGGAFGPGQVQE